MKKVILQLVVCTAMLLAFSTNSYSAPMIDNISGVISHGKSVTIYGSDFGDKSPAAPIRFEDFEESDSLRTGGNQWDENWWGQGISYFRVSEPPGNRIGAYCGRTSDMGVYRLGGPGTAGLALPTTSDYIYVYRKEYYNYDVHPSDKIYNHKNFRVWSNDMKNNFTTNMGNRTYGTTFRDGQHSYGAYNVVVPVNHWNTFEFALKNSSLNGHDGKIRSWYNNQSSADILHPSQYTTPSSYANLDSIQTRYDAYPNRLTVVFHEHMADNEPRPPIGSYVWVDDLYIDNTWARVMIGDEPTYDSCTNREIQIPSAWSSTSITITVNQGSFKDGDRAYLFVVDADGNVSNGYPITIGGSGGTPADNPPNVSITSPTNGDTCSTASANVTISGNASDDNGISSITWSNNRGGNGTATNSSGDWSEWSISGINLQEGENVITITATDSSGSSSTDSLTINYTPPSGTYTKTFGEAANSDYPGTVQDTFLNINNDVNSKSLTLNTYTWPTDRVANAIVMKWDLSALPADAEIQNAILYLYLESSGGDDQYEVSVHKIINYDPNIAQCNGYTYDGTNGWTPNSQCYNNIPLAQADISQAEDTKVIDKNTGYKTWNVTQMVRDWVSDPSSNYGLLLNSDKTASADSNRIFASSEATDASRRPKLVITYTSSLEPDTTPPGDVTNASITAGVGQLTLSWTNPTDSDFAGVMIRFRTDGTHPQSATDGQPVPNGNNGKITGVPGATMSYIHSNLDPDTHYYYSIFTYDTSGNYSHTVFLDAQPLPPDSGNQAPTASISASPTSGESPLTVTFSGSGSDSDGTIESYSWNFGDGTTSTSQNPTHTYAYVSSETQYTVTLTVTDDDGATGQATTTITVSPDSTPPMAPQNVTVE